MKKWYIQYTTVKFRWLHLRWEQGTMYYEEHIKPIDIWVWDEPLFPRLKFYKYSTIQKRKAK